MFALSRVRLLFCLLLASASAVAWADETADETLLEALRAGGNNIYFRHVATDWTQSDDLRQADDWLNCDTARMRQLSDAGRADAIAIGEAMGRLEIPVGEVLASPYCRTMETARLMNLGSVTASTDVMNLRAARFFGGREAIVSSARRLLATPPATGSNRIIVAHGNVARESTPFYPDEGEGLVFKPDGKGGFDLLGRIPPSAWKRLVMRYNP